MSTRKPSYSMRARPRPIPKIMRPLDMLSSSASCSATRSGSCQGSTTTPEPSSTLGYLPAQ